MSYKSTSEIASHEEGHVHRGATGLLEQHAWTTIRIIRLTRQGVRDLNGPYLNGTEHNGKAPSCAHYRSPDMDTYRREELVKLVDGGVKFASSYYCSGCGELRWTDLDDEKEVAHG